MGVSQLRQELGGGEGEVECSRQGGAWAKALWHEGSWRWGGHLRKGQCGWSTERMSVETWEGPDCTRP